MRRTLVPNQLPAGRLAPILQAARAVGEETWWDRRQHRGTSYGETNAGLDSTWAIEVCVMEADDLDSLIADSLSGVQAALDGDRKERMWRGSAGCAVLWCEIYGKAPAATDSGRSADQAVRELQQGVGKGEAQPPGEAWDGRVKPFGFTTNPRVVAPSVPRRPPASTAVASSSPSGDAEDFLQNFMKSFDQAAGSDGDLEKQLTNMMTSMLSSDLLTDSMKQIADALEPYLKTKKGLSKDDRKRYEAQLRLYRSIVGVYKQLGFGDAPRDGSRIGIEEKGHETSIVGCNQELTKVMKEMAGGVPEEVPRLWDKL
eukprot:Skav209120  [mRNA]  locus=scaffold179:429145:444044:- [translate_table: standard]